MNRNFHIVLWLSVLLTACGRPTAVVETDEAPSLSGSINPLDSMVTGKPIPCQPVLIPNDSFPDPFVVKAGKPVLDSANKNIFRVNPPDIKLLSPNLPHFVPGNDAVQNPVVKKATGKRSKFRYAPPVTALSPNFKDAASYNLQYLDVDQGLSSSYVMNILEDSRGNLWFANWTAGVSMYDGKSFMHFKEIDGFMSNYIWTIHEDRNGNMWFGSDGIGVCKYDGNSFMEYSVADGLASNLILDIAEDEDGNLWFATGEGLSMFDGTNFTNYTTEQGLSHNYITSLLFDHNGDLWLATDGGGINRFHGTDKKGFTHYTTQQGLPTNNINVLFEDSSENIWIGTLENGVCLFDGYSFFTYTTAQGLSSDLIYSIAEDSYGNIWFGTDGGGACMFNRSSFVHFTENEGLSTNIVRSVVPDSDGNIWLGTYGAGVNKYNEKSFENYTDKQGLNSSIVRNIIEDREGNLWFGQNNGVSKYNGKLFAHYTEEQGLSNNVVRQILEDHDGNLWFATNGGGANKFDGESFTHYTTREGMSSDIVLCMYEDSKNNLWFGTNGGGITKFDGTNFYHLTEEQNLGNNTIRSIIEDRNGNMWFGTNGGGTDKFDGTSITHYTTLEGMSEDYILSLLEDKNGNIWVGTEGGGLSKISGDTITKISVEEGLSNNIVWSIIEDFNSNLWVSTENGVNLLTPMPDSTYQIITYGKLDGLKGVDFYPNSVCLDSQNKLWWGSGKALTMLDLNKYEQITDAPVINMTDVSIEQTFVDYRQLSDTISKGYTVYLSESSKIPVNSIQFSGVKPFSNCPENLELPYNLNHLTFHFSAIDWSAPHKIKYQYKLEGLDQGWSPVLQENRAIYSNLPWGKYTFKVKAIGEAQLWSDVLEYPIIIHPPWWFTWWAYLAYILIGMVSIFLIIRWRTHKLVQHKKELEQIVTDRTQEVVQQKELVEMKNKEITDSITYAKRIQEAILPSGSLVHSALKDAFILYKPKDIVAGDFYWLEEKNNKILLAAADCTGHGVPGAMVSVVCNNALNRAVREFDLDQPGQILNKVRDIVIETFNKSGEDVKDGMDIALVSIKFSGDKTTLEYSGANNSLFIMVNGKLTVVPADKQPIGKYALTESFTNHSLELKKGDTFYIFTDGFIDQFGGEKGKKLKFQGFMNILHTIQNQPMKQQKKAMDDFFSSWKGALEQVDDVCVIGVRI
ncbi:MAG: SpoIIE family protein phosphatase [Bacteroidetes bacterium]|nr:SpoIIE family protein phosphatase [Bacteroidota bacterium]